MAFRDSSGRGELTPELEESRKRKERFTGGTERFIGGAESMPGRLLRAKEVGQQRLRQGTQEGIAAAMGPGPLSGGQMRSLADTGGQRALREAEFGATMEKDIGQAEMMAGQAVMEGMGALEQMSPEKKIEQLAMQVLLLQAQDMPQSQIDQYLGSLGQAESMPAVRQFLSNAQQRQGLLGRLFGGFGLGRRGGNPEDLGGK